MEGFLGGYQSGQGMASGQFEVMKAIKGQDLAKQYQLGSPEEKQATLGQIAQFDPQQAQFLQQQEVAQQAQQVKRREENIKFARGVKSTIGKADERQQPAIYKAYLAKAEKQGKDVSDAPEEWGNEANQYLDMIVAMSGEEQKERKIIKDINERQRYADTGEFVFKDIKRTESPEQQAKREEQIFKKETTLRKEFTANSKDFVKIRDAHNRVKAAAQDPSAAGDLALIFNYMKVLDPGSVVRESEFATAANAAGVPDRIRNIWNKARKGTRLALDQRKDFVDRSDKLYRTQEGSQKRLVKKFGDITKRAGGKKENVLLDFIETPEDAGQPQKQLSEMTIEELQALRQQSGGR